MALTVGEVETVYKARDEMSEIVDRIAAKNQTLAKTLADVKEAAGSTGSAVRTLAADLTASATAVDGADANFRRFNQAVAEGRYILPGMSAETQVLTAATGQAGIGFSQMRGGLNEVATGLGMTVAELGLFTSAGLVAGAAMSGWQVGRSIANFFDLDDAIANTTARLLGFGNVAAEQTAAKMEMLARASAIAKFEITDVGVALKVLTQHVAEFNLVATHQNAAGNLIAKIAEWNDELKQVAKDGAMPALKAAVEAGIVPLNEIAKAFGLSSGAMQVFMRSIHEAAAEMKQAGAAADDFDKRAQAAFASLSKHAAESAAENRVILGVTRHITDEYDKHIGKLDEIRDRLLVQASLAERAARNAVQGARGFDVNGNALGAGPTPDVIRQQKLEELERTSAKTPGVDTTFRRQQIDDEYIKSIEAITKASAEELTAIVGMTAAEHQQHEAADRLTKAHQNQIGAVEGLGDAFGKFTGTIAGQMANVNLKTGEGTQNTDPRVLSYMSMGYTQGEAIAKAGGYGAGIGAPKPRMMAEGGIVDRPTLTMLGEGGEREFVIPESKMAGVNGGGSPSIHVAEGAIQLHYPIMNDPRALLMLRQAVGAALTDGAKQQRQL